MTEKQAIAELARLHEELILLVLGEAPDDRRRRLALRVWCRGRERLLRLAAQATDDTLDEGMVEMVTGYQASIAHPDEDHDAHWAWLTLIPSMARLIRATT